MRLQALALGCCTKLGESFTAFAHDPLEPSAASLSSAGQPAPGQQQSQRMVRLLQELQKLKKEGWLVYGAKHCFLSIYT